jgi:c-di-GMP-related signal transduction protein
LSQVLDTYVARAPVLDVRQRTIGYGLLFPASLHADWTEYGEAERAISEAIVRCLVSLAEDEDMNGTLGFVEIPHWFLHSDLATELPTARSVLVIPPNCPVDSDTVERCRELIKKGVKLCLDDIRRLDRRSALFDCVDYVRIDTRGKKRSEIRQLLRSAGRAKARKIAGNVDTPEVFEQIPIQEDLQAAVTDGAGRMGALLNLQRLLERAEFPQLECELAELGITPGEFDEVQREALSWAARLASGVTD